MILPSLATSGRWLDVPDWRQDEVSRGQVIDSGGSCRLIIGCLVSVHTGD